MKKKIFLFLIIFLATFFFLFAASDVLRAGTDIYQENFEYDHIYFNKQRSPYEVKDDITLRPGQRIKIDSGVEFAFSDSVDLCFSGGGCIKGDFLCPEGIGGKKVEAMNNIYVLIKRSTGTIKYFIISNGDSYKSQSALGVDFKDFSSDSTKDLRFKVYDRGELSHNYELSFFPNEAKYSPLAVFDGNPPYVSDLPLDIPSSSDISLEKETVKDVSSGENSVKAGYEEQNEGNLRRSVSPAGNIFLQIEENGEAWYINPLDSRRYYLGRPADAFRVMKDLSLGVKHSFMTSRSVYPESLAGRILLDVEDSGKSYYIDTFERKAHYLGRPADAFDLMKTMGVGIKNSDLEKIPLAT